jgi:transcription initiation factor IIE alpha subunit
MTPIINVTKNTLEIDIDALAEHLGINASELRQSMQLLGLNQIINEAKRLNADQYHSREYQIFPRIPIKDSHLIEAASKLLYLNPEKGEVN